MQLGIVGLIAFASIVIGALWRSWFLAVDRPMDAAGRPLPHSAAALRAAARCSSPSSARASPRAASSIESGWVLLIAIAWSTKQRQWAAEPLPAEPPRARRRGCAARGDADEPTPVSADRRRAVGDDAMTPAARHARPRRLRDFAGSARFAQALTLLAVGFAFSTHAVREPHRLARAARRARRRCSCCARSRSSPAGVPSSGTASSRSRSSCSSAGARHRCSGAATPAAPPLRVVYLVAFAFARRLRRAHARHDPDRARVRRRHAGAARASRSRSRCSRASCSTCRSRSSASRATSPQLGPIQGIFGSRNMLGFVALIALLTFIVEWRTRIVTRAAAAIALDRARARRASCSRDRRRPGSRSAPRSSRSPRSTACAASTPATRWRWQIALLVTGGRRARHRMDPPHPDHRAPRRPRRVRRAPRRLARALALPEPQPAAGLGLGGSVARRRRRTRWIELAHRPAARLGAQRLRRRLLPGRRDRRAARSSRSSASRSCARGCSPRAGAASCTSGRRSCSSSIAVTSFAESFALVEGGWMLLVVCAVKAARDMSWRDALAAGRPPTPIER